MGTSELGLCEVRQSLHKGHGLFATRNIFPGEVIITSTAFAVVYVQNFQQHNHVTIDKLLTDQVANILDKEPQKATEFFQLFAGPELNHTDYQSDPFPQITTEDHAKRIESICLLNSFRGSDWSAGVWIQPSFINHSCFDCNCNWTVQGEIMVVRAFKEIPEDSEILISYVAPDQLYKERLESFNQHLFLCSCRLCLLDRSENVEIHEKRDQLLSKFKGLLENEDGDVERLEDLVVQLNDLRPREEVANPHLIDPMNELARKLFGRGEYRKAMTLLEKLFQILSNYPFSKYALDTAFGVLSCHLMLDDRTAIEKWIPTLRLCATARFGTLGALETYGYNLCHILRNSGFKIDMESSV